MRDVEHPRQSLDEINDEYTEQLNMLLEEGREDLVAELSERYVHAVANLLQHS